MLRKNGVLVIGLDGATFDLLNPLIDANVMPNLQSLIEKGASGPLRSTIPPVTGPAWASFQTGTNPGKHGIVDFLRYTQGSYEPNLISSEDIAGKTLWGILSDHNKRVCLINVPLTYPPQRVNGYLVSGFLTPNTNTMFTYPPNLRERLLAYMPDYNIVPAVDITKSGPKRFINELRHTIKQRERAAHWLIEQDNWDFFMVHFQAVDLLQHALWNRLDPSFPGFDQSAIQEQSLIRDFYEEIDQIVGDLARTASDATIIVMSDHGFGPGHKRIYLNKWLVDQGYLSLKVPESRMRIQADLESLLRKLDVFNLRKHLIPRDFRQRRARLVRQLTQDPWIDWHQTRAFVFSGSTFGNLYVNLAGREPLGTVRETEYEEIRTNLSNRFQELVDPDTGKPVIERVHRREEVFEGPKLRMLPDLIVRPRGGYLLQTRFKGDKIFEAMPQGVTGLHRMNGICVLSGSSVAQHPLIGANIIDLAPTILCLLGVSVPDWMDGKVLRKSIRFAEEAPLPKRHGKQTTDKTDRTKPYANEDESEVWNRLHDLGYV